VAKSIASLVCGLSLALVCNFSAADTGSGQDLLFRVMLDDREIGYHRFRVSQQDGSEVVEIDAEFLVTFLAIPVYRYDHRNREVWRRGCLQSIVSATDDDGDEFEVEGKRKQNGFEVATLEGEQRIESDCVMSFAYWNRDFLQQDRLLNAQNGEYLAIDVEPRDREILELPDRDVAANAHRLRNSEKEIDITVWHARDSGRWLSLESRVEGGRVIRYLPADPREIDTLREKFGSGDRSFTRSAARR
jgi:hypothetical protein